MCSDDKPGVGDIGWNDLTVENAEEIRDFYKSVVGWESDDVEMDGYSDFNMITPDSGETIAGICHRRGPNKDFPPQWVLYFIVEDVGRSAKACESQGGKILVGPKKAGDGSYCIIQDPAGAVCGLYNAGN
jgi:predicted enzyme related to lactoylglutathione lyase